MNCFSLAYLYHFGRVKMSEIEIILSLLTENRMYKCSWYVSRESVFYRFAAKKHNTVSEVLDKCQNKGINSVLYNLQNLRIWNIACGWERFFFF